MRGQSAADSVKPYLDYLDKEMTIQGILSGFCFLVAGLIFDRVFCAKPAETSAFLHTLQISDTHYLLWACVCLVCAGIAFYLQRSELAALYGDIALAITYQLTGVEQSPETIKLSTAIQATDTYRIWTKYNVGRWIFLAAIVEFGLAISALRYEWLTKSAVLFEVLPIVLSVLTVAFITIHRYSKDRKDWPGLFD